MIIVICVIMKASSRRQVLSIFISFCGEFLRHHLYVVCLWWQQWWAELAGGRMIPACNLAPPTWDLEWRVAALWPWSGWVSGRCGRQCALPHSALTHSETRSWGIGGWLGDIPWEDCVVSNKCAVFTESHNITCTSITSSHHNHQHAGLGSQPRCSWSLRLWSAVVSHDGQVLGSPESSSVFWWIFH